MNIDPVQEGSTMVSSPIIGASRDRAPGKSNSFTHTSKVQWWQASEIIRRQRWSANEIAVGLGTQQQPGILNRPQVVTARDERDMETAAGFQKLTQLSVACALVMRTLISAKSITLAGSFLSCLAITSQ
jgi:hypothetical protein